jgi:hypothetical protein
MAFVPTSSIESNRLAHKNPFNRLLFSPLTPPLLRFGAASGG